MVVRNVMCVFFFQAEDGIRDDLVTGVQTCALPISRESSGTGTRCPASYAAARGTDVSLRSEERRVGKECRARWWREHKKKKYQGTLPRRDSLSRYTSDSTTYRLMTLSHVD